MSRHSMIKSELISVVSKRFPQLTLSDTALSIQTILNGMANHLANSGRIEIRNFGSFDVKLRLARISRNPRTGEKVYVGTRRSTRFKPGFTLKNNVKNNDS